jgi:hypothetical protein
VNRAIALLVSVIGGAACALVLMMVGIAASAGILWLFIFGDDPWPAWVEPALNLVAVIAGLLLWTIAARLIWLQLKPA